MRQDRKISFIGGIILLVVTVAAGMLVYLVMQRQAEAILGRSLQASLQSNVRLFESQINQVLSNARTVATRPYLVQNLQLLQANPADAQAPVELQRAARSFLPTGFTGMTFYDALGREVAHAGEFSGEQTQRVPLQIKERAFLLWNGQFVVQARLDILNQQGQRVGAVAVETSLPLLARVFGDAVAIGSTGEFAVCAPLEGTTPATMDCFLGTAAGQQFKHLPRVIEGKALPMDYALKGESGLISAMDYRQRQVIAAHVPMGSFGFGTVLKIDQAELYSPVMAQLKFIGPLLLALVIIGVLMLKFLMTPLVRKLVGSEQTLRESEERFRTLSALSSDWFWEQDKNYRFVQVSGDAASTSKFARANVTGMTRWELDHVNMDDAVWEAHKAQLERHEVFRDFEITLRHPNGQIRYETISGVPIFDATGVFTGYRGTGRDDTEMRRMTEAVRASEAQLRQITNAVPAGITYIDAEQRYRFHNRAYEEVLGLTAAQIEGKTLREVLGDELYEPMRASVEQVLAGYPVVFERSQSNQLGNRRDYVVNYYPRYGNGKENVRVIGFYALTTDITELKRMDRMKSEFVSTVSHELRTPLTSIRGSLGLIAGGVAGALPDGVKTLVNIAKNNCERLIRLINDILDIEKLESGKMSMDLQVLELRPLMAQVLAANEGYGAANKVGLHLHFPDDQLKVHVDSDRLTQVLTNLLSNAMKFSPPGGAVEVHVTRAGLGVRVEVRDHGPGIPEEFRKRIFQKFSQADSSDTRQNGGTGLGLNISRAIVERMGGSMGFDSVAGGGATFFFELPEWTELPAALGSPDAAQRPRILICEDDRDIARLIGMMLDKGGFDADTAYSAEQTLALLAHTSYAGMTLDLKLPDQSGITLIRRLRQQASTRDLPIVVVSAMAGEGQIECNALPLNVSDWLDKPIDENLLILSLRRAIERMAAGKPRILHVEDDIDIQRITGAIAQDFAVVEFAATLQEARLRLLEQRFDLVLLDLALPQGSGWDLLADIETLVPPPPVVVFSVSVVSRTDRARVAAVLVKAQTSNEELLGTLKRVLPQTSPDGPPAGGCTPA